MGASQPSERQVVEDRDQRLCISVRMKVKLFREREACLAGGKLNKFLIVGLKSDVRVNFWIRFHAWIGRTCWEYHFWLFS